ncbi:MAG: protein kinase [Polyangiaceae bacterium]
MSKDLEAPGTLRIGSVFHRRFRIVRCIKTGGMGAVYEVVHLDTQRPRALKVLLAGALESDESRARFEREATIAAGIRSNHIVEVLDAGVDAETQAPFIVMELLVGEDLGSAIARRPLPPSEVVEYLRQAARGLEKTHAAGIVHRDLKPENLFLTRRDDGSPEIKVLDFGIAKVTSGAASAPATRGIVGTPLYIAPEQVTGDREIGPRTDVYALGHVAYALLTGQAFFQKENAALVDLFPLLMAVVKGAPEPPSERARRDSGVSLPAAFDAWFLRATAREPADRFASVTEAVTALERALVSAGGAAANVARTAPDLDRMRSEAPAPKPTEPVAHAASSARTIDDPSFKMSPAARSIDAQIVAASPAPVRAASRADGSPSARARSRSSRRASRSEFSSEPEARPPHRHRAAPPSPRSARRSR